MCFPGIVTFAVQNDIICFPLRILVFRVASGTQNALKLHPWGLQNHHFGGGFTHILSHGTLFQTTRNAQLSTVFLQTHCSYLLFSGVLTLRPCSQKSLAELGNFHLGRIWNGSSLSERERESFEMGKIPTWKSMGLEGF